MRASTSKTRLLLAVALAGYPLLLGAFEEVEPNEESAPNIVPSGSVIRGTLNVYPSIDRDTFLIKSRHRVPVRLTATARVTSGANPGEVPISMRIFGKQSGSSVVAYGNGKVEATIGFPYLLHQPSDLLIQMLPHTLDGGERYEIVFQLEPLDLVGPRVSFGRIGLKAQVEKFLGSRTRSVPFRVYDRNQVSELWVRSEGEPYREMKVKTDLYKRPLRTVRDRFRFRTLKKNERVFVKATDGLGNTSVHSTQYRRISDSGSDFRPEPESGKRP
jgi:hypothetical protein